MAIEWYFALAKVLALAGVDIDEVFDMVEAWLSGDRPVWLRSATDPATGLRVVVLWGRVESGRALAVYARPRDADLTVFNATYLDTEQQTELLRWEATHHG